MLTLKAEIRSVDSKPDQIRMKGDIPAVFYGKKEVSTPITVSRAEFMKVWNTAGESSVVTLKINEADKESLIHDVDFDPITGAPRHADFYVFEKGRKVEVDLPIEFSGVSSAVKDLGGSLIKVLHELKIEALPKDLPHQILVDISALTNFGDQILAKDIILPNGLILIENPDEVVALVSAPREEKEEVAPIDLSTIEVEKKGKEDTDENLVEEGEKTQ